MRIHWCGTGRSSVPGLRRLIQAGHPVTAWTLPAEQAVATIGDLTEDIREMEAEELGRAVAAGDIVVSMGPEHGHLDLAQLCVERRAHFVSPCCATPELRALDDAAREAGVVLVTEVGLDPGVDHLMAHDLVAAYRAAPVYHRDNVLFFTSYCGELPAVPNAFRHKFSSSPLGMLRALQSPATSIRDFSELRVAHPWDAVRRFSAPLPRPETFEVYPSRDCGPYLAEYGFDAGWRVKEFVHGTLCLNGWVDAWAPVLDLLAAGPTPEELAALSNELSAKYPLPENEPDRVVLCVSLKAERDGRTVWHRTWTLDAVGDVRGSAMARLVSGTVALAVEGVMQRELPVGLHGAPRDPRLIARWLEATSHNARYMQLHLHA